MATWLLYLAKWLTVTTQNLINSKWNRAKLHRTIAATLLSNDTHKCIYTQNLL